MIEVNYKPLDLSATEDKFTSIYKGQINFLKSLNKKWFTFVFPDSKIKIDEEGNRRHNNGSWFDLHEQYSTAKDGVFDIRYYKNVSYDKKTGVKNLTPRKQNFDGYLSLSMDRDEDLIWYLIFVSRHMEPADWLVPPTDRHAPNQVRNGRNIIYFKVENVVKAKENEYDTMALVQRAMAAIYDKETGLNDEQILYYARSYNVPFNEGITPNALRQELGSRVLVMDKRGKYNKTALEEFLKSLPKREDNTPESIESRALVNDLLDLKLVVFSPKGRKQLCLTPEGVEVMTCGISQDGAEALTEFFVKNEDKRDEYTEVVKQKREEQKQTA